MLTMQFTTPHYLVPVEDITFNAFTEINYNN
jgi:hypothetical protein